jgi:hypothetical protein
MLLDFEVDKYIDSNYGLIVTWLFQVWPGDEI